MTEKRPTVVVVDDLRELAELYATWLADDYAVRTAYSSAEAMELIDCDVDVALIDRRMPGDTGDELLERIRDAGYDCRVAMITAVEPDFDIIELGFDEYLVKPIDRDELHGVVESLLNRADYDEQLRTFFALAAKRATLQSRKAPDELEDSEAYAELTERIEELRSELDATVAKLSDRDFEAELRQLNAD